MASLQFTDFSSPEGFASKSLATENTVEPGPIVRELIQNSLDAGHLADRSQVKVSFAFENVATENLPGIEEYKEAFHAAKKTHRNHLENVRAQVSRIENSLAAQTVSVLNVRDNGVGLNSERMNSLLGDGTTSKNEAGSAGSYGLGHFTAFPASNLHFILYGGVMKDSTRVASSHAILASHEIGGEVKGKDGYLIKNVRRNRVHNRYVFPTNGEIPYQIGSQLDVIEKEHESGSVISITAFNDFLEEDRDSSVKAILATAAKHFSPAIHKGSLVIEVTKEDGSTPEVLDRESLGSVIEENIRGQKRGKDKLSPTNAYNAYETLVSGERREVETSFGKTTLCIRQSPRDTIQINLFRSGMWITNDLPRNKRGNYSDYKPFNALVLIDPPCEAFELVRKSEGEKHLDVSRKRLIDEQRKKFDKFWGEIREKIAESLERSEADEYSPSTFMLIPPEMDEKKSSRRGRAPKPSHIETTIELEEVPESTSSYEESEDSVIHPDNTNHTPNSGGKHVEPNEEPGKLPSFNRGGRTADVVTAAKFDSGKVKLVVRSNEYLANAGVRLSLDTGTDASCEKPLGDQFLPFKKCAEVDGNPVEDDSYREGREGALELLIGAMKKDQARTVVFLLLHKLPKDAVIKVNVVSRER